MTLKYPRRKKRQINGDIFDIKPPDEVRSQIMAKIPSQKTTIELLFAKYLREEKIKYRSGKQIYGKPDFKLFGHKIVIFCDGDFWHGYKYKKNSIKSNTSFWNAKIQRNIERDKEVNNKLEKMGYKVIRFWEHEIKKEQNKCIETIKKSITKKTVQKK